MDRRSYLTGLGAAVAAVSGCSGGDSTATTGTATSTATPTPEPEPSPRVRDAGLLLDTGPFTSIDDALDAHVSFSIGRAEA